MLLILSHISQAHSSAATRIRGWQTHLSCALPIAALPSSPAASKPFPSTRLSSQILPGLWPKAKGKSGCVGVKGTNFSSFLLLLSWDKACDANKATPLQRLSSLMWLQGDPSSPFQPGIPQKIQNLEPLN